MPNRKILIVAHSNITNTYIELKVLADGEDALTKQEVLDAISDYLLIDPRGLFSHETTKDSPRVS